MLYTTHFTKIKYCSIGHLSTVGTRRCNLNYMLLRTVDSTRKIFVYIRNGAKFSIKVIEIKQLHSQFCDFCDKTLYSKLQIFISSSNFGCPTAAYHACANSPMTSSIDF